MCGCGKGRHLIVSTSLLYLLPNECVLKCVLGYAKNRPYEMYLEWHTALSGMIS